MLHGSGAVFGSGFLSLVSLVLWLISYYCCTWTWKGIFILSICFFNTCIYIECINYFGLVLSAVSFEFCVKSLKSICVV
ncbi:hypothetical protein BD289DRAFT_284099 [Coniella lustricola]|uniref:Uncharacterized protein n=1 Tax=Coniella lustricola TaxID=2025994 RepID=A0A2T3AJZ1_9PEZI|nr:hypothetical protein BD289DRAFT_284099 [Coniella lustricola]